MTRSHRKANASHRIKLFKDCQKYADDFLKSFTKYRNHLKKKGTKFTVKEASQKIQWHLIKAYELEIFRSRISDYVQSIQTMYRERSLLHATQSRFRPRRSDVLCASRISASSSRVESPGPSCKFSIKICKGVNAKCLTSWGSASQLILSRPQSGQFVFRVRDSHGFIAAL